MDSARAAYAFVHVPACVRVRVCACMCACARAVLLITPCYMPTCPHAHTICRQKVERVDRACKMLTGAATAKDRSEFIREAEMMLKFRHVNLVNLIGVAVQQKPWLCVLEFCKYVEGGSWVVLRNLLRNLTRTLPRTFLPYHTHIRQFALSLYQEVD